MAINDTIAEKKQKNETKTSTAAISNFLPEGELLDLEDPENRISYLLDLNTEDNKIKSSNKGWNNNSVTPSLNKENDGDNSLSSVTNGNNNNTNATATATAAVKERLAKIHSLKFIISSSSFVRLIWDNIIFLILFYFSIVIPLRITLLLPMNLFYFDYLLDCINVIDAYLHFTHFSVNTAGKTLLSYKEIQKNYLFSFRFFLDFLVILPYDLLCLMILNRSDAYVYFFSALLRLPKLLKLLLIPNYHSQVERFAMMFKINRILYKILELTFSILMISHWIACGWYMFSEFHNFNCTNHLTEEMILAGGMTDCKYLGTWVEVLYHERKVASNGSGQWTRFLRAFYWAIPTVTADGDRYVMNEKESLYAFIIMFCGLSVNGTIIGSVVALVSDANHEITHLYRQKELLRAYLLKNHISENLIISADAYLTYLLTYEGSLIVSREHIFSELPHSLKIAVDNCWYKLSLLCDVNSENSSTVDIDAQILVDHLFKPILNMTYPESENNMIYGKISDVFSLLSAFLIILLLSYSCFCSGWTTRT
jgi:hypothetical protein